MRRLLSYSLPFLSLFLLAASSQAQDPPFDDWLSAAKRDSLTIAKRITEWDSLSRVYFDSYILEGRKCSVGIGEHAPEYLLTEENTPPTKFWIFFADKGDLSNVNVQSHFAQRSIERRINQEIGFDEKDYPINAEYLKEINLGGIEVHRSSKWLNAISAFLTPNDIIFLKSLPFVKEVRPILPVKLDMDQPGNMKTEYLPGFCEDQIEMLGLDQLHKNGFLGQGILIAQMDNGWYHVDQNPALKHLFDENRIVATWDFVNNDPNVFDEGFHGGWCLSILAGYYQDQFIGSAPGASYILCHTENDASETHQEEDNWVMAMEYADSIGADVFSTSLGYSSLDTMSYTYADLNGDIAIITIAADIAASRGIVVVNSAGNNGVNKISAPADGDSVIAIGAVDKNRILAGFSSLGPSADGRIKPDLCAQGSGTSFVTDEGNISSGGGTSFSCPMMAGLCACLLQTQPRLHNMGLYDALIKSADRYANPDTFYGYGIPYGPKAYQIIHGTDLPGTLTTTQINTGYASVYPNPAGEYFNLAIDNRDTVFQGQLEMFDMMGRKVMEYHVEVQPFFNLIPFSKSAHYPTIAAGFYSLRFRNLDADEEWYSGRIQID